jgi:asparagine synthase (glutamine-hydrolysing)
MSHQDSFTDCMPLISRDKNVVLIFQGENYLDNDGFARMRRSGRSVDRSNARYLLELYSELGEVGFLRQLNGWYCGVIVDLRTKRITLFNDRYGIGRVYIHEGKDEFLFASEAKSLLKIRPALRTIEPEALAEYLRFNCVIEDKTIFKGVSLLPGGSSWVFENNALKKKQRYFDFRDWENQPSLGDDALYARFAETVSTVFPAYAESSQKIAVSLTAGLDTRAIMAALKQSNQSVTCYTFGGSWGELFDIRTARKIAKLYNESFDVIKINEFFLKDFSKFAQKAIYLSDGTHDAFGAHDVYFNEVARNIAPIRLTGKFGSEVVRVRKLVASMNYQHDLLQPNLRSLVNELPSFMQINQKTHPLTRVVSQEIPWHEFGRLSIEQSKLTQRTPYMDNKLVQLMFQATDGIRTRGNLQERYVRDKTPELSLFMTNLGLFAKPRYMTKVLYGLLWALFKIEYIYLYATPHWLTRIDSSLERLKLERILSGRQKWEAYRIWIRTHFADFIRQTLLSPGAHFPRFFEKKTVEEMITRHIAGTHNYLNEINKVLTIELICSTLLTA